MLTEHEINNIRKAARAGLDYFIDRDGWDRALDHLAKAAARPGESFETAYTRLMDDDTDFRAILKARQGAADLEAVELAKRGGRPREHSPEAIRRSKAEAVLSDAAMRLAATDTISYETAFAKILETPAGGALYKDLRS